MLLTTYFLLNYIFYPSNLHYMYLMSFKNFKQFLSLLYLNVSISSSLHQIKNSLIYVKKINLCKKVNFLRFRVWNCQKLIGYIKKTILKVILI